MSESEASRGKSIKFRLHAALALLAGLSILYLFTHPFVAPHLVSPPYEWPAGCKPDTDPGQSSEGHFRYYGSTSKNIPRACIVEKYYFKQAEDYNFPKTRASGGQNYYRIDRDAFNIYCPQDQNDPYCKSTGFVRDVFIDKDESK